MAHVGNLHLNKQNECCLDLRHQIKRNGLGSQIIGVYIFFISSQITDQYNQLEHSSRGPKKNKCVCTQVFQIELINYLA